MTAYFLGTTCMLEELEDGMPISEADQARVLP